MVSMPSPSRSNVRGSFRGRQATDLLNFPLICAPFSPIASLIALSMLDCLSLIARTPLSTILSIALFSKILPIAQPAVNGLIPAAILIASIALLIDSGSPELVLISKAPSLIALVTSAVSLARSKYSLSIFMDTTTPSESRLVRIMLLPSALVTTEGAPPASPVRVFGVPNNPIIYFPL